MRAISVWEPWASLLIARIKRYETRAKPAPQSLIGQRFAIANTKIIRPEQRVAFDQRAFRRYLKRIGWATFDLDDASRNVGCIVGTARLIGCQKMTAKMIRGVGAQERAFGIWKAGRFAWEIDEVISIKCHIPVRGQQGLWTIDESLLPDHHR